MESNPSSVTRKSVQLQGIIKGSANPTRERHSLLSPEKAIFGWITQITVCTYPEWPFVYSCLAVDVGDAQPSWEPVGLGDLQSRATTRNGEGTGGYANPREENNVSPGHDASGALDSSPIPDDPMASYLTPLRTAIPVYHSQSPEIDPSDNVIISYLLRHFKEGPGRWCVKISNSYHGQLLTTIKDGSLRHYGILLIQSARYGGLENTPKIGSVCTLREAFTACLPNHQSSR